MTKGMKRIKNINAWEYFNVSTLTFPKDKKYTKRIYDQKRALEKKQEKNMQLEDYEGIIE